MKNPRTPAYHSPVRASQQVFHHSPVRASQQVVHHSPVRASQKVVHHSPVRANRQVVHHSPARESKQIIHHSPSRSGIVHPQSGLTSVRRASPVRVSSAIGPRKSRSSAYRPSHAIPTTFASKSTIVQHTPLNAGRTSHIVAGRSSHIVNPVQSSNYVNSGKSSQVINGGKTTVTHAGSTYYNRPVRASATNIRGSLYGGNYGTSYTSGYGRMTSPNSGVRMTSPRLTSPRRVAGPTSSILKSRVQY